MTALLLAATTACALWADGARAATRSCSSFGVSWEHSYNLEAAKQGNPIRILSACCKPGAAFGENACTIMVTLAGTADRGCESVVLDDRGVPVSAGRHVSCPRTG